MSLAPVNDNGTATADGNMPPLADGAASLILLSAERARKLGAKPLATVAGFGIAAGNPTTPEKTAVRSIEEALKFAGTDSQKDGYDPHPRTVGGVLPGRHRPAGEGCGTGQCGRRDPRIRPCRRGHGRGDDGRRPLPDAAYGGKVRPRQRRRPGSDSPCPSSSSGNRPVSSICRLKIRQRRIRVSPPGMPGGDFFFQGRIEWTNNRITDLHK